MNKTKNMIYLRSQRKKEILSSILDKHKAGLNALQISEQTGIQYNKIYYLLKKNGVNVKAVGKRSTIPSRNNHIAELFKQGTSTLEIAKTYRLSHGGICQILNGYGLSRKKGPKRKDYSDILDKHKQGLNNKRIGELHKISRERVRQIVAEAGLSTNKIDYQGIVADFVGALALNQDTGPLYEKYKHVGKTPAILHSHVARTTGVGIGKLHLKVRNIKLIADVNNNVSLDDVIKKYSLNKEQIFRILEDNGVQFKEKYYTRLVGDMLKKRDAEILELVKLDMSDEDIGLKYNVSRGYVFSVKKRNNIT